MVAGLTSERAKGSLGETLRHQKCPFQVDIHNVVPLRARVHFGQPPVPRDPGAVDQDVRGPDCRPRRGHGVVLAHVHDAAGEVAAALRRELGERLLTTLRLLPVLNLSTTTQLDNNVELRVSSLSLE